MIVPVILSGGSGTRLWPLSRAMYPKQFIRFFNGEGRSLLGATLERLGLDQNFSAPIVVCNNDHRFLVREELARAKLEPQAILLEPVARNTAAAVAVAALFAERRDADAVLLVMPSDHVVADNEGFLEGVKRAAEIAATGRLVLFGVKARRAPHRLRLHSPGGGAQRSRRRVCGRGVLREAGPGEGRGLSRRGRLLLEQRHLRAPARAPISRSSSGSIRRSTRRRAARSTTRRRTWISCGCEPAAFAASPNISIDYAVMEKTKAAAMLPLDVGWSDVGSWSSLWEVAPHDEQGNAVEGDAVLIDTTNCLVRSERSLVAAIGVDDLVIVDTPDAAARRGQVALAGGVQRSWPSSSSRTARSTSSTYATTARGATSRP